MSDSKKQILNVLSSESLYPPPLWMMRQAGRYLPEYRELRKKAGSFLDLCYNSDLASEVTLQPIRRFGFDAAIVFSDILVVPHALGQNVSFVENEGPKLEPVNSLKALSNLIPDRLLSYLSPVFETLQKVKSQLDAKTALLGFCGAPWTVASYMIAGKGTPDQAPARIKAYEDPEFMEKLLEILIEASVNYLVRQLESGADAVQIFESFGGGLSPDLFEQLSFQPIKRIVEGVRKQRPEAKIIVFIRGGASYAAKFACERVGDAFGIDWATPLETVVSRIGSFPTQGNLDPLALYTGGVALDRNIDHILSVTKGRPHIFNLGHGIIPQTPLLHVEHLIQRVRNGQ